MARPKFCRTRRAASRAVAMACGTAARLSRRKTRSAALAADIGGGGRRHRDIGSAQRRRIVEPVADHQHAVTGLPERIDVRDLVGRPCAGREGQAERLARSRRPARRCRRRGAPGEGPTASARRSPRCAPPRSRSARWKAAMRCPSFDSSTVASCAVPRGPIRTAQPIDRRRRARLEAVAGMFGDLVESEWCAAVAERRDRLGIGMARMGRRSPTPARPLRAPASTRSCGWPAVSVPVLSKITVSTVGEPLQRAAVLDHDAALEQPPRRDDLDHRHRKAERAGAGDDQHRDRDGDGAVRVAGRDHPAEEGQRSAVSMHDRRIEPRGAVGDAAIARSGRLRPLPSSPHHLGEEGILGGRRRDHRQRAGQIERCRPAAPCLRPPAAARFRPRPASDRARSVP